MKHWRHLSLAARLLVLAALLLASASIFRRLAALEISLSSPTREGFSEAIAWDGLNPDFFWSRARIARDSLEEDGTEASRKDLETAIQLNPWNWFYWGDLATLRTMEGDLALAEKAYQEAARISPLSGYTRWNLANFYLRRGDREEWLSELGAAVSAESSYREPAALLMVKMGVSPEEADSIWPQNRTALLSLMRFLASYGESGSDGISTAQYLQSLWKRLIAAPEPLEARDADFYFSYLLERKLYGPARAAWVELMGKNGIVDRAFAQKENYVWDGGFETSPCNRLLCWYMDSSVEYSIWQAQGADENYSNLIRVEFPDNSNIFFQGLRQTVLVDPGARYELSFRAKSEGITSDQGIFMQILDSRTSKTARTEEVVGTRPWRTYAATFEAPEDSALLTISLRRERSRRLGGKLAGTLWVDDVALKRMER